MRPASTRPTLGPVWADSNGPLPAGQGLGVFHLRAALMSVGEPQSILPVPARLRVRKRGHGRIMVFCQFPFVFPKHPFSIRFYSFLSFSDSGIDHIALV